MGDEVRRLYVAIGGYQHPGEHLDCSGLARPIGPDVADQLTPLDGEGHVIHGAHHVVLARKEGTDRAQEARLSLYGAKFLI